MVPASHGRAQTDAPKPHPQAAAGRSRRPTTCVQSARGVAPARARLGGVRGDGRLAVPPPPSATMFSPAAQYLGGKLLAVSPRCARSRVLLTGGVRCGRCCLCTQAAARPARSGDRRRRMPPSGTWPPCARRAGAAARSGCGSAARPAPTAWIPPRTVRSGLVRAQRAGDVAMQVQTLRRALHAAAVPAPHTSVYALARHDHDRAGAAGAGPHAHQRTRGAHPAAGHPAPGMPAPSRDRFVCSAGGDKPNERTPHAFHLARPHSCHSRRRVTMSRRPPATSRTRRRCWPSGPT